MKNKVKLRVFQIYLHVSKYDTKIRIETQKKLTEHIQYAINKGYMIAIMGDFNVDILNQRMSEYHYKNQFQIIKSLQQFDFHDVIDTIHDVTESNPHNTWFSNKNNNDSKTRIDYIWLSSNLISHLLYANIDRTELYSSDHAIITCLLDKDAFFNNSFIAHRKQNKITKTVYQYNDMNDESWKNFTKESDV